MFWSIAAVRTRHRPAATVLYERLLPWHEQFATTHVTVHGAVAHYLGLLAHALDRDDDADRWFGQALALHESMEAPFFVASTQTAWAELLTDRDKPGDARRARALADTALSVASTRGYRLVERDARAVLEITVGPGEDPPRGSGCHGAPDTAPTSSRSFSHNTFMGDS